MATIEPGVYRIQNVATGTFIELPGGSATNATNLVGHAERPLGDVDLSFQLWILVQVGSNVFTIQNPHSLTFVDLSSSNPADGTPIIGFQGTGNPNQSWAITRTTDGEAFVIENQATNTFVDLLNGGTVDGTLIQGWAGLGPETTNPHQRWAFIRP